jgi:hypothetical protein
MSEQALPRAGAPARPRPAGSPVRAARLGPRWPYAAGGGIVALYALIFVRGLAWQWHGILTSQPVTPPLAAAPGPPPAANSARPQAPPLSGTSELAPGAAAPGTVKVPLPPTDEPPPRETTDRYGVYYDAQGVAVIGIDTDPGGVYNVPPGRQVRIGGPAGALFDVQPGGKLTPATRVKEWPR